MYCLCSRLQWRYVFQMGGDQKIDIIMREKLSTSALEKVIRLEETLISAITKSDLAVLDQLLDDELIFTNHMGMSLSKQDDLAPYRSGDLKIKQIKVSDQQIKLHQNTAVVAVSKSIQGAYCGEDFNMLVRFTRVWNLENSQWKVIAASSVALAP